MAESSLCLSTAKNELAALKETLYAQQHIIQNLSFELEKEREASATAASEALSMILRIQGEKAAEKMEAYQYKRMAEEKIHHVEDSLAMLEELVYRKDMEIASLLFQVQAYKHKLLSMGFSDLDIDETEFPKNLPVWKNEMELENMKTHGALKRGASLPIKVSKDLNSNKQHVERGPSLLSKPKINGQDCHDFEVDNETKPSNLNRKADPADCSQTNEGMPSTFEESVIKDCNLFCEILEEKDQKVNELSHTKSINEEIESEWFLANQELQSMIAMHSESLRDGSRSCSWHSVLSRDPSYSRGGAFSCLSSQAEALENIQEPNVYTSACMEAETDDNTCTSASIQDIFEIPQNSTSEGENRIEKLDSKYGLSKDEALWVKKAMISAHQDSIKKALIYGHQNNKLSIPRIKDTNACHWPLMAPKIVVEPPKSVIEQLDKRLQLLEDERHIVRQEALDRRKEEMGLLGEICERIKVIQSHLKTPKAEKRSKQDDSKMASFMEAMLSFSI